MHYSYRILPPFLCFTQLKLLFESCLARLIFVWIDKPKPSMKTCVSISHRANGIFICSRKGCRSRNSDHFVTGRLQTQRHHVDRRRDCSIASQWEERRCVRSILQFHKGLESVWAIYMSTSLFSVSLISQWHWLLRLLNCRNQARSLERKRKFRFNSSWKEKRTSRCMKPIMASSSTFKWEWAGSLRSSDEPSFCFLVFSSCGC